MNKYHKWYEKLVNKARNRIKPEGYTESHHVLPKCMGGTNDPSNLIFLTGREHFIAHLFLARMDLSKKHHIQMLHAADAMANKYTQDPTKRQYNSRLYESLKKELNQYKSELWSGDGNPSKNLTGEKRDRWIEKNRIHAIKRMKDPIFYDKYKKAQKDAVNKPEHRQMISEKTKNAMWRNDVRENYLKGIETRVIDKEYHRKKVQEAISKPEYKEKKRVFYDCEKHWYTNGVENTIIKVGEDIPEGWYKGMTRTEEDKKRIGERLREINKNREPWNKGKKGLYTMSAETRKKMSDSHIGKKYNRQPKVKV